MRLFRAVVIFMCVCLFITSCNISSKNGESRVENCIVPDKLDVFIVSDAVHEYYSSEERENVYYTTIMSVGDFDGTTTTYGEKGFMFYEAFEEYQKETGINLNVHWYEYPEMMEADMEKLSEENLPDLILSANSSSADYYRYMEEGYFYDLTTLFEQYEMYTNNEYYSKILRAGEYGQKQYIVPILFTVDTIMGSTQIWEDLDFHMEDVETHSELLDALLHVQKGERVEQVISQFVSASPSYVPHIVYGSSGEKWVDYDNWTVNIDEDVFKKMGIFYEQFLYEQFDVKPAAGEEISWGKTKHIEMCMAMTNEVQLSDFISEIGGFVEGGGSFQTNLHSAAAQAWYYESRYRDREDDFEIYAMPGMNGGSTAHVSYFGAVMPSSEYPEASFSFLKYLMDCEIPAFFGMSVNRENTEKQMEYFVNNAYYMRPGLKILLEDGTLPDSPADYLIQPMSEKTRDKLMAIVDNIENVTLPDWPVYFIIDTQLQKYAKGECTIEEAYQSAVEELELYAKRYESAWKQ